MPDAITPDGIRVDFLILADAAQVQGEKLHMLGGGWSLVWAKEFPAQHQMAVAAGILVPWMETNTRHQFRIRVVAEDGGVFGEVGGEFEQGRPAGMPAGTTQRVMIAANIGIRIERACEAAAELWLDGALARSVPFRVVQRQAR
jgi:hypothetical protein